MMSFEDTGDKDESQIESSSDADHYGGGPAPPRSSQHGKAMGEYRADSCISLGAKG